MVAIPSNSSFDAAYYLRTYTDVNAAATKQTTLSVGEFAYTHYLQFGAKEQRNPSALFNTTYYFLNNSDVLKAFNAGTLNPLTHFDTFGWQENRNASAIFNTSYYTGANPLALTSGVSALAYYETTGIAAAQAPSLSYAAFDYNAYLTSYSDVAKAILGTTTVPANSAFTTAQKSSVLTHWINFGEFESRTAKDTSGNTLLTATAQSTTTFSLTVSATNSPSAATTLTGTTGNDSFALNIAATNANTITIAGAGGTDSITISDTGALGTTLALPGLAVTNVQSATLSKLTSGDIFSFSGFDSTLTSITDSADVALVTFTGLTAAETVTLKGLAAAQADTVNLTYATGVTTANIALNSVASSFGLTVVTANATGTALVTQNISTSTAGSLVKQVTLADTADSITKITVTGSAALNLNNNNSTNTLATIDSSAHTGGFLYTESVKPTVAQLFKLGAEGSVITDASTARAVIDTFQVGPTAATSTAAAGSTALAALEGNFVITGFGATNTATITAAATTQPTVLDVLSFSQSIFGITSAVTTSLSTTALTTAFNATSGNANHNLFLSVAAPTSTAVELDSFASKVTAGIVEVDGASISVNGTSYTGAGIYFTSNIHSFSTTTAVLLGVLQTTNGTNAAPGYTGAHLSAADFGLVS